MIIHDAYYLMIREIQFRLFINKISNFLIMEYIINTDINIAQAEVNELNEKTKHLWKEGITKRLVNLQPKQFGTQYMYPFLEKYKEY